jgi:hypothetical protein
MYFLQKSGIARLQVLRARHLARHAISTFADPAALSSTGCIEFNRLH